jgi:glycosyltransferase involved in cell wall biosynthesis
LIVTAGRLHPQKGHRYLLEAIDELVHRRGRSLKLLIFGKGESEASLKNYVRTQGLESSVMIAGFVNEPRRWYSKAQLFVLPSLFEGMPNALIEAAAVDSFQLRMRPNWPTRLKTPWIIQKNGRRELNSRVSGLSKCSTLSWGSHDSRNCLMKRSSVSNE